jgi:hypothetical protein
MNNDWNAYTITLKPARKLLLWLLPIITFYCTVTYFIFFGEGAHLISLKLNDFSSYALIVVGIFIAAIILNALYKALWAITGKLVVTVDSTSLTTEKYIAGICSRKVYSLAQMSNLGIEVNEKSKTYFGASRGTLLRMYYENPILLYFVYNGSDKCIGNYCAQFPAEELRNEILKRQSSNKS